MSRGEAAVLTLYYVLLGALTIYALHRLYLVRLRRRCPPPARPDRIGAWPSVTVQLPLYNEPNVAARLIEAAAAMRYEGALDIQVLDDSTDGTPRIVADVVERLQARGVAIEHIRRESRDGYKAGALAHGLATARGELIAIFDADFVPPEDFLERTVPAFADERTGLVQGAWGHLNRDESILTRVQAIYLDAHFAVESAARHFSGRFFNFNGTAGIWRRRAIDEAGGWSAATLTEDLDLSYRAQLAGWRFRFLHDVEVPAELPGTVTAFQQQQQRWAKGSIQTARRLLRRIVTSDATRAQKVEACFHLTNNIAYLLTFALALLVIPSIVIRQRLGVSWLLLFDLAFFAMSTGAVLLFYIEGQKQARRGDLRLRDLLAVLPIGLGISIGNAWAVTTGLVQRGGEFRRTPKRGDGRRAPRLRRKLPALELLFMTVYTAAVLLFARQHAWTAIPIMLLFLSGYAYVAVLRVRDALD